MTLGAVLWRSNTSGAHFAVGEKRTLGGTRIGGWESTNQATPYAITADGSRFLVNNAAETVHPIHLFLNWSQTPR